MLDRFRDRLVLVAVVVSVVAAGLLLLVAQYQPSASAEGWRLGATQYTVLTDVFSALLSIGLITLIFELFLRESYARGLRKFLDLNTALVTSGLSDIQSGSIDVSTRLAAATKIQAVVRDPQAWVLANYASVVAAAVKRATTIDLIFPDVDSPYFPAVAESLDYSPDELRTNLELAVSSIRQRWATSGQIHTGSSIAVKTVPCPLYEVTCIDDFAVCSLDASVEHPQGGPQLVFAFAGKGHPIDWFRKQITSASRSGELWAGDDRTPAPRRRSSSTSATPVSRVEVGGETENLAETEGALETEGKITTEGPVVTGGTAGTESSVGADNQIASEGPIETEEEDRGPDRR